MKNFFKKIYKFFSNFEILFFLHFTDSRPPRNMLKATQELIQLAVQHGQLAPDYNLHGHRQVKQTACPGKALFNKIKRWPHFVAT